MTRWWPLLAVLVALLVTAGIGWSRYTNLRPLSSGVATRTEPLMVNGASFRVLDLQRLQRITFTDHDPLVAPDGAVWVRLDAEVTLVDASVDPATLNCYGVLVSAGNEWTDDYDPASYSGDYAQKLCDKAADEQPLQPGVPKRLVLHWLVPTWAADDARYYLRLATPPTALELLP